MTLERSYGSSSTTKTTAGDDDTTRTNNGGLRDSTNNKDDGDFGQHLECDYLIIGAGTSGMSFVDTLITEDQSCTVIIADRNTKPGGHWTTAYPFVRLHQPSCSYGVNSLRLGKISDSKGREKQDYQDRATAQEVVEYYEQVADQFRKSGRVKIRFGTEYHRNENQEHVLRSQNNERGVGLTTSIVKCGKIVRCVSDVIVPSMRKGPLFQTDESVSVKPVNTLPNEVGKHKKYVILGAGKTATDSIVYLIDNGVDQSAITWVISRDVWFLIRDNVWPSNRGQTWKDKNLIILPLMKESNCKNLFLAYEQNGILGRLQPNGPCPGIFKGAAIEMRELEILRSIKNTIRLGRVTRLGSDIMVLEQGEIPISNKDTVFIDCMAENFYGAEKFDANLEIFEAGQINIGPLLIFFNPSFSAAILAYLEATFKGDDFKNQFCYYAKGKVSMDKKMFLTSFYCQNKTLASLGKYKPAMKFIMGSRTNSDAPSHHGGLFKLLWAVFGPQKLKRKGAFCVKKMEDGGFDELKNGFDTYLGRPVPNKIPKNALRSKTKKDEEVGITYPPKA